MKLKLHTYPSLSILVVTGRVLPGEPQILVAGIQKLRRLSQAGVFVDFSSAHLDDGAQLTLSQRLPQSKQQSFLQICGPYPDLCPNEDLLTALESEIQSPIQIEKTLPSLKLLYRKIQIEQALQNLQDLLAARLEAQNILSAPVHASGDHSQEQSPSQENAQKAGNPAVLPPSSAVNLPLKEEEWIEKNKGLRTAQTLLINHLLDPVFNELPFEPSLEAEHLTLFEQILEENLPQGNTLEPSHSNSQPNEELPTNSSRKDLPQASPNQTPQKVSPELNPPTRSLYAEQNLENEVAALTQELKQLKEKVAVPFYDNRADRLVSLILEQRTLSQRINEVSAIWISRLLGDSVVTERDFEEGYAPLLEAQRQHNTQKKSSKEQAEPSAQNASTTKGGN